MTETICHIDMTETVCHIDMAETVYHIDMADSPIVPQKLQNLQVGENK